MTKRDLVVRISRQTGINQRDVMRIVQLSLDEVISELAANRGIEFDQTESNKMLEQKRI